MAKTKDNQPEVIVVGQEAPEQVQAPRPAAVPAQIPITFDAWWIQTAGKYGLKQDLKQSVKRHFEARGYMNYRKFNAGLRDFGFRT